MPGSYALQPGAQMVPLERDPGIVRNSHSPIGRVVSHTPVAVPGYQHLVPVAQAALPMRWGEEVHLPTQCPALQKSDPSLRTPNVLQQAGPRLLFPAETLLLQARAVCRTAFSRGRPEMGRQPLLRETHLTPQTCRHLSPVQPLCEKVQQVPTPGR